MPLRPLLQCNIQSGGAKIGPVAGLEGWLVQVPSGEARFSARLVDLSTELRLERHHPEPKKFGAGAAIRAALHCLQLVDLPLCLTIAPRQNNRIADCGEITPERSRELLQARNGGVFRSP